MELYTDCVTASSVNMFKNKVDTEEGGLHKMTNVGLSISLCTQTACYLTKFTFDVAPKVLNHHANISPVNYQCHHFGERGRQAHRHIPETGGRREYFCSAYLTDCFLLFLANKRGERR